MNEIKDYLKSVLATGINNFFLEITYYPYIKKSDKYNDIVLLKSQVNFLEKNYANGIISYSDMYTSLNRTTNAVLLLIDELKFESKVPAKNRGIGNYERIRLEIFQKTKEITDGLSTHLREYEFEDSHFLKFLYSAIYRDFFLIVDNTKIKFGFEIRRKDLGFILTMGGNGLIRVICEFDLSNCGIGKSHKLFYKENQKGEAKLYKEQNYLLIEDLENDKCRIGQIHFNVLDKTIEEKELSKVEIYIEDENLLKKIILDLWQLKYYHSILKLMLSSIK